MNTFDPHGDRFREDQMPALLKEFFAGEMPAEVCELVDEPVVRRAPEPMPVEPRSNSRLPIQVARLMGMAAALAGVLILAWNLTPHQPPREVQVAEAPISPDTQNGPHLKSQAELVPDEEGVEMAADSRTAANATRRVQYRPEPTRNFSFPSHAIGYDVTEKVASLGPRKYATQRGPVEQRTQVRTTNVSFLEPKTGTQVQFQVPEIEIEILMANDEGT